MCARFAAEQEYFRRHKKNAGINFHRIMKLKSAQKVTRLRSFAMLSQMQTRNALSGHVIAFLLFVLSYAALIPAIAQEKDSIFVSILPQKFLLQKIVGDRFDIQVLVGPGMSPHSFEPLPQQMAKLARTKAFIAVGLPFEEILLAKIRGTRPDLQIIKSDAGIKKRLMHSHEAPDENHTHSAECDHSTGTPDPHIWLDPQLAKIQAETICSQLKIIIPEHARAFTDNLKQLKAELDKIDHELETMLQPFTGKTVMVFHPAFGYFTDRYGLKQRAVEIEGKEPTPKQMVQIIRQAKEEKITTIFVQQQFSQKAAQTIAEAISGKVVAIDPLAEDYFEGLKKLGNAMQEGFSEQ